MAKLRLSPGWDIYYRKLSALFGRDDEVRIVYDETNDNIKLYVDNVNKADALAQLLPIEKEFGSVTLTIEVIPCNTKTKKTRCETVYHDAFDGNPILSYIKVVEGVFSNNITYVVFNREVIQYFNDSLADIHGMCSTLAQDIAREVFEDAEGVFFCTDTTHTLYGTTTVNGSPFTISTGF